MNAPRFYVQETWGFFTARTGAYGDGPGVSAHVLDRLYNHKPVAIYRSEDEHSVRTLGGSTRDAAIAHAAEHAARLNAEDERAASGAGR